MMNENFEKVRSYLLELEFDILKEDKEGTLFVVEKADAGISNLILDCEESILIIEGVLFELKNKSVEVLEELLLKNREIIHGAFALSTDGNVIFRDTLQLENLDLNELEGSLNSLELLLSEYAEKIIAFAEV